jgi:hypothetical protein
MRLRTDNEELFTAEDAKIAEKSRIWGYGRKVRIPIAPSPPSPFVPLPPWGAKHYPQLLDI